MKQFRAASILLLTMLLALLLNNISCGAYRLDNGIFPESGLSKLVKAQETKSTTSINDTSIQTLYSTLTTVNTTTMTLVETTGPLFGEGPLLVIYDVELFFEENDVVRIETSQGARVFIHPSLEEFERDGWVRLYKVHESGSYKIRVTTGHGAERLFVNIYRISSETYYLTITSTTMNYTGHETVSNITSLISETFRDTWVNNASSPTSSTLQMEGVVEVVPGYSFYAVVIGIFVGAIITFLTRRSNYKSTRT